MSSSHIMSNMAPATVMKFSKGPEQKTANTKRPATTTAPTATSGGFACAVLKTVWACTVLTWPLLKWVLSLDCVFKLIRMMYYWHTPGMHAGFTFLSHFTVFALLTYFATFYKPKGL